MAELRRGMLSEQPNLSSLARRQRCTHGIDG
jgi:hypothetical protein